MATGASVQPNRGIVTSNIHPTVSLPDASDDWERLGRTFDRFGALLQPELNRQAADKGAAEGAAVAAGTQPYKRHLTLGEASQARAHAFSSAYLANVRNDIDTHEAELRRQYAFDPDGYQKAADAAVSGFIQGAPGEFAVSVETYAKDRVSLGLEQIADQKLHKDQQEAVNTIGAREKALDDKLMEVVAAPGGESGREFDQTLNEWDDLQKAKVDNPLFAYTKEQAALKRDDLMDRVQGTVVSRHASEVYADAGGGLAGKAAALNWLKANVLRQPITAPEPTANAPALPATGLPDLHDDPGKFFGTIVGRPVTITSAKRTPEHNAAVHGSPTSEHLTGDAWDIVVPGIPSTKVVAAIRESGVPFDQLINEGDHVHFGVGEKMRRQVMIRDGQGYRTVAQGAPPPQPPEAVAAQQVPVGPDPFEGRDAKRFKFFRQAAQTVNDLDKADAEQRSLLASQERDNRQAKREAAGELSYDLTLGTKSEADVKAAVAHDEIDEASGAHLIASARAQTRREATEARTATSLERTETYGALSELADAGQLGIKDLATAGASLTGPQRLAIKARITKGSRPVVQDILSITDAGLKDAGITGAAAATLRPQIEHDAADWALQNPNAPPNARVAWAGAWLKSAKGIALPSTSGPKAGGVKQTYPQFAAAYRDKFRGQRPSKADVDRAWARYSGTK